MAGIESNYGDNLPELVDRTGSGVPPIDMSRLADLYGASQKHVGRRQIPGSAPRPAPAAPMYSPTYSPTELAQIAAANRRAAYEAAAAEEAAHLDAAIATSPLDDPEPARQYSAPPPQPAPPVAEEYRHQPEPGPEVTVEADDDPVSEVHVTPEEPIHVAEPAEEPLNVPQAPPNLILHPYNPTLRSIPVDINPFGGRATTYEGNIRLPLTESPSPVEGQDMLPVAEVAEVAEAEAPSVVQEDRSAEELGQTEITSATVSSDVVTEPEPAQLPITQVRRVRSPKLSRAERRQRRRAAVVQTTETAEDEDIVDAEIVADDDTQEETTNTINYEVKGEDTDMSTDAETAALAPLNNSVETIEAEFAPPQIESSLQQLANGHYLKYERQVHPLHPSVPVPSPLRPFQRRWARQQQAVVAETNAGLAEDRRVIEEYNAAARQWNELAVADAEYVDEERLGSVSRLGPRELLPTVRDGALAAIEPFIPPQLKHAPPATPKGQVANILRGVAVDEAVADYKANLKTVRTSDCGLTPDEAKDFPHLLNHKRDVEYYQTALAAPQVGLEAVVNPNVPPNQAVRRGMAAMGLEPRFELDGELYFDGKTLTERIDTARRQRSQLQDAELSAKLAASEGSFYDEVNTDELSDVDTASEMNDAPANLAARVLVNRSYPFYVTRELTADTDGETYTNTGTGYDGVAIIRDGRDKILVSWDDRLTSSAGAVDVKVTETEEGPQVEYEQKSDFYVRVGGFVMGADSFDFARQAIERQPLSTDGASHVAVGTGLATMPVLDFSEGASDAWRTSVDMRGSRGQELTASGEYRRLLEIEQTRHAGNGSETGRAVTQSVAEEQPVKN
jgi:hypothetical protein